MNAILTYHSIDDSGSPISIPAAAFEAHRQWLLRGDVKPTPLGDLVHQAHDGPHRTAITFDDAFVSSRAPIERLLDSDVTPVLFVVTRHVGGNNAWGGRDQPGIPRLPLMSWDDLGRLAERGARIEAHSRTHPHLTRISPGQLDEELGGCAEDLQTRLGVRSTTFAYPYGDVNERVASRTANWFASAVTTRMAPLDAASLPLLLPRLDMYYFRHAHSIESWGRTRFRARVQWIALRRRLKAALPEMARG